MQNQRIQNAFFFKLFRKFFAIDHVKDQHQKDFESLPRLIEFIHFQYSLSLQEIQKNQVLLKLDHSILDKQLHNQLF